MTCGTNWYFILCLFGFFVFVFMGMGLVTTFGTLYSEILTLFIFSITVAGGSHL